MDRLQKRAWYELVGVAAAVIFAGLCLSSMVKHNVRGVLVISAFFLSGGISGIVAGVSNLKTLKKYDERERAIYMKALLIASFGFIGILLYVAFIIFFIVGGKGTVPVYVLPAIALGGLFIAQLIQSGMILIQCAMEEDVQEDTGKSRGGDNRDGQ